MKWCWLLKHQYYVYAKPIDVHGDGIRWLKCKRCHRSFVINDRIRALLPMDFEIMDMHTWAKAGESHSQDTNL